MKAGNIIRTLSDQCIQNNVFQCPSSLLTHYVNECEAELLRDEDTSHCQYVYLDIPRNHLELIPEINQLLVVFPQEETIKFQCPDNVETKNLQGIFLIEQKDCKIIRKGEPIEFNGESRGKPLLFDSVNLVNVNTFAKSKMILRNLRINDISANQMQPLESNTTNVNTYLTVINIMLGLIFGLIFGFTIYNRIKDSYRVVQPDPNQEIPIGPSEGTSEPFKWVH